VTRFVPLSGEADAMREKLRADEELTYEMLS
jgi:hypothetical protein